MTPQMTMTSEQWLSALADAFDLGMWAAYNEERDGGDGSEVPNPYRLNRAQGGRR